jgi:hypothetical protein
MLRIRIREISRARSHEHEDGNGEPSEAGPKQLEIRRRTAMREVRAQLDAVRATLGGRERGLERLDRRFD